jgi:hypothetical protein
MTNKNKTKVKKKIEEDNDFIYCPRLGNSLNKFAEMYPEGVDDEKIAKVLMIETTEVEDIFASAIEKIRKNLKLKKDDVV